MVEVVIIRPEKEIGMGCCGGVCGEGFIEMKDEFNHHDEDRQRMGELYRALSNQFGNQIEITYVDPRNLFAIALYFIKQLKYRHITLIEAAENLIRHIKYNAVFVNGKYSEGTKDCDTLIKQMLILAP
ncbi:hypothetical protein [Halobacillus sp. B23F22_1]|uniref:hypothetical protein n=1 Tax=Halobacillus sp. B23F22_1 TaxID=3459514 RepID=UPI00373E2FD8